MATPTKLRVAETPELSDESIDQQSPPELEAPKRLVVEVNRRTAVDLTWLVDVEELNKTTIVNRAVQVYKRIIEMQRNGGGVVFEDPVKGSSERVIFI